MLTDQQLSRMAPETLISELCRHVCDVSAGASCLTAVAVVIGSDTSDHPTPLVSVEKSPEIQRLRAELLRRLSDDKCRKAG